MAALDWERGEEVRNLIYWPNHLSFCGFESVWNNSKIWNQITRNRLVNFLQPNCNFDWLRLFVLQSRLAISRLIFRHNGRMVGTVLDMKKSHYDKTKLISQPVSCIGQQHI